MKTTSLILTALLLSPIALAEDKKPAPSPSAAPTTASAAPSTTAPAPKGSPHHKKGAKKKATPTPVPTK